MNEEQLTRMATRLRRAERAIIGLAALLVVVMGAAAAGPLADLVCRSLLVKDAAGKTTVALRENGDVEVGGKLVVNGVDLLAELKRIVDDKGVIHARGLTILSQDGRVERARLGTDPYAGGADSIGLELFDKHGCRGISLGVGPAQVPDGRGGMLVEPSQPNLSLFFAGEDRTVFIRPNKNIQPGEGANWGSQISKRCPEK
jgi:hypothetical protein